MDIRNKKALVVGCGRSGIATARFLKIRGAIVTISDMAEEDTFEISAAQIHEMGVRTEFGGHDVNTFVSADFIVISPGVPHTILPLTAAAEKGVPVLGEIELASQFIKQPIIAVTGTNGKTTTTRLVGDMLAQSGRTVFVGGNIGKPLIGYVIGAKNSERVVVEISSFQLDTIKTFKPAVSVLLNITHDHLDRYPDFTSYVQSKGRIFENQDPEDTAVLNGQDPHIRSISKGLKAGKLFFAGRLEREAGADIGRQSITYHGIRDPETASSISLKHTRLQCRHEWENIAAASLAALAAGGTLNGIQRALNEFKGLPHRMEHIDTINGIHFCNDSKATNIDSVARAIECLKGPINLIMGGRNKGNQFHPLRPLIQQKIKSLIVLGEAAKEIEDALGHLTKTQKATSMKDAVMRAFISAVSGDTVLLSPACASFDMYRDYKARGNAFREAVHQLKTTEWAT